MMHRIVYSKYRLWRRPCIAMAIASGLTRCSIRVSKRLNELPDRQINANADVTWLHVQ